MLDLSYNVSQHKDLTSQNNVSKPISENWSFSKKQADGLQLLLISINHTRYIAVNFEFEEDVTKSW